MPEPDRRTGDTARVEAAATASSAAAERRTSPIELLWDLVFVFAITQVTALLGHDLTWTGLGHSLLVLALVWWAWSAFVWAANAAEDDSPVLRAILLLGMLLIFVSGLALPHAFGDDAALFAVSYAAVRLLHLALYAQTSRQGNASWAAISGFAVTVLIGMALLIAGSFLDTTWQAALWTLAAAIDYAGPAWLTRERLRGLQYVAVSHFAERYGLFVIICLGESIVAIGVGASGRHLDAALVGAIALGLLITIALWWVYFDRFATRAEDHLREHDDPVLAAADAYSYLHLPLVAGIIVFAVGAELMIHDPGEPLEDAARLALCGGVALYLLAHAAFQLRIARELEWAKPATALAVLVVFAVGGEIAGWGVAALIAALLAGLCALEVRAAAADGGAEAGSRTSPAASPADP
jgi:low temperature requirement protein LtrA